MNLLHLDINVLRWWGGVHSRHSKGTKGHPHGAPSRETVKGHPDDTTSRDIQSIQRGRCKVALWVGALSQGTTLRYYLNLSPVVLGMCYTHNDNERSLWCHMCQAHHNRPGRCRGICHTLYSTSYVGCTSEKTPVTHCKEVCPTLNVECLGAQSGMTAG